LGSVEGVCTWDDAGWSPGALLARVLDPQVHLRATRGSAECPASQTWPRLTITIYTKSSVDLEHLRTLFLL